MSKMKIENKFNERENNRTNKHIYNDCSSNLLNKNNEKVKN